MINLIAAVSENNVIGKDGDIPWHLPPDLKHFKQLTQGHNIIMGRKTWDSLPKKPLPNRTHFVITSDKQSQMKYCEDTKKYINPYFPHVFWCQSFEGALSMCQTRSKDCFIIGGSSVYKAALEADIVDTMYLTLVRIRVEGDAYFPQFDRSKWKVASGELGWHGDTQYAMLQINRLKEKN